ncbi:hypothetical protein INR49_006822 [Caranx melampygus]|nr:hypothetical protein INR49_006822 [Caranx melampygus]
MFPFLTARCCSPTHLFSETRGPVKLEDPRRAPDVAAADKHETQGPTERPGPETPAPESQGRTALYVVLGLVLAAAAAAVTVPQVRLCRSSTHRSRDQTSVHWRRDSVPQRTDFALVHETAFHCTESLT